MPLSHQSQEWRTRRNVSPLLRAAKAMPRTQTAGHRLGGRQPTPIAANSAATIWQQRKQTTRAVRLSTSRRPSSSESRHPACNSDSLEQWLATPGTKWLDGGDGFCLPCATPRHHRQISSSAKWCTNHQILWARSCKLPSCVVSRRIGAWLGGLRHSYTADNL